MNSLLLGKTLGLLSAEHLIKYKRRPIIIIALEGHFKSSVCLIGPMLYYGPFKWTFSTVIQIRMLK